MSLLISGMLTMGYLVASLFFLRFWRETRDRLFLIFSVAFFILAFQRAALSVLVSSDAAGAWLYVLRLAAFLLILAAIVDKNRISRT